MDREGRSLPINKLLKLILIVLLIKINIKNINKILVIRRIIKLNNFFFERERNSTIKLVFKREIDKKKI